jgi:hypothetical protein
MWLFQPVALAFVVVVDIPRALVEQRARLARHRFTDSKNLCNCVCVWVCVCVCLCLSVCVCLVMGERLKKRTEKRSFRVELVRVDQKSLSLLILATFLNSFVRLLVCLFVCLFNWLTDMSKKENVASNIRNNNSEQIVLQLISRTS